MPRTFIVDIQGFRVNGSFVVKEVAILDCTTMFSPKVIGFVFDAPFPSELQRPEYRRQTEWIKQHLGLRWEDKGITYSFLSSVLKASLFGANVIYVKGAEKKEWLKPFVSSTCELVDLHDMGCPKLQTLVEIHQGHETEKRSLCHVLVLFQWLCCIAMIAVEDMCSQESKTGIASETVEQ